MTYDNTNYEATYRLANGNEILQIEHHKCCSIIGEPANVYPYDYSAYSWLSCSYTYIGPAGGTVSATFNSINSDNTLNIGGTNYNIPPFGVLVFNSSSNTYLELSDVVGYTVTLYKDSLGRAGLLVVNLSS